MRLRLDYAMFVTSIARSRYVIDQQHIEPKLEQQQGYTGGTPDITNY